MDREDWYVVIVLGFAGLMVWGLFSAKERADAKEHVCD